MKANKAKTSKKADKKISKRAVKKELEVSISDKILEALKGFGHDAEKISKEIKKASRELAKKLSDKYKKVRVSVEEKLEAKKEKPAKPKRPLTSAKRNVSPSAEKAENVVARVTGKATTVRSKAPVKRVAATKQGAEKPAAARSAARKPAAAKSATSVSTRKSPASSTNAKKPVSVKPTTGRVKAPATRRTAAKPEVVSDQAKKPENNVAPVVNSGEEPKTNP